VWLTFFLEGVRAQSIDAIARAERLTDLREKYRALVQAKTRGAANQLVDLAFEQPVLTAAVVERRLGVSRPAALNALRQLADAGVVVRVGEGPRRQQRWRAHEVLSALTEEVARER
jgi:Fic family protein